MRACCAHATSGHVAAPLPTRPINSRRFMPASPSGTTVTVPVGVSKRWSRLFEQIPPMSGLVQNAKILRASFRFTTKLGNCSVQSAIRICANSGPVRAAATNVYSITSFAKTSSVGGTVTPMACAVLTLMTSSNLLGCSIGMSAGFAPLSILSIKTAERRNRSASSTA
jgi:hypothetical protein